MELIDTKFTYIVLVHHYEIPILKLASGKNLQKFATSFNFQQADAVQDGNTGNVGAILFRFGVFRSSDGKDITINRLNIEIRKILFEIDASSQYAEEIYREVKSLLADYADTDKEDFLEPIVIADESQLIVKLNFSIDRLIAPKYLGFVQKFLPDLARSEYADAKITPSKVEFTIEYDEKNRHLRDRRITLSRKEFSVQPAIGYLLDEQIYFSKAPFDTYAHIQLLSDLEEAMMEDL